MRATIDWSYDLLDSEEQRAYRALSVFAGGCTLDAALPVAGADLETLQSLLDKSLLGRLDGVAEPRYGMLETIREHAGGELARQNEDEPARDRHATWVLAFARETAPRWGDPAPIVRLERRASEAANIRVALARAIERRDASTALELVGLIGRVWMESGMSIELLARSREALALGGADPGVEGMALLSFGWSGEHTEDGRRGIVAAAERFRHAGMPREAAYATMSRGMQAGNSGSIDEACELLKQALVEFERLGDSYLVHLTRSTSTPSRARGGHSTPRPPDGS